MNRQASGPHRAFPHKQVNTLRLFRRSSLISVLTAGLVLAVAPLQALGQDACASIDFPRYERHIDTQFNGILQRLGITDCHGQEKTGQGVTVAVWGTPNAHDCLVQELVKAAAPGATVVLTPSPDLVDADVVVRSTGALEEARDPAAPTQTFVNLLNSQGKLVVFSAGNTGQGYHAAIFTDSNANQTHDFNSRNSIAYSPGTNVPQVMDACVYWGDLSRELGIQLVDRAGNLVSSSAMIVPGTACITPKFRPATTTASP